MKTLIKSLFAMLVILVGLIYWTNNYVTARSKSLVSLAPAPKVPPAEKTIKIGLMLDTSNSMDGLIDQAKSQLWRIVSELSKAKVDGTTPRLQIALYEYGNDNLSRSSGYVRKVTSLTTDLDLISKELFALKTNGGDEYCGEVITAGLDELEWGSSLSDLKLIYIAGNESFAQGYYDYQDACEDAIKKDIKVNTIYCGPYSEGIELNWKDGARIGDGSYISIEQDRKTTYIETPYDNDIAEYNNKLNDTYLYYGSHGLSSKNNQLEQDNNARNYGTSNTAFRVMSKTSSNYSNSHWDLVDHSKTQKFDIKEIESQYLPEEMRKMTEEERLAHIKKMDAKRESIKKELQSINLKREEYIEKKRKELGADSNSLDEAMLKALREAAKEKNFTFE